MRVEIITNSGFRNFYLNEYEGAYNKTLANVGGMLSAYSKEADDFFIKLFTNFPNMKQEQAKRILFNLENEISFIESVIVEQ